MSRKEGSFRQLIGYMEKDRGEPAFGHNLCGNPFGRRDDIIREFERNAGILKSRKNGNALYHEVISLQSGSLLRKEEIIRILGEIGREYIMRRAPHQMAFGMVHTDAKHVHLHICLSANAVGTDKRERLSKESFSIIQKDMEQLVRQKYAELAQTPIYTKDPGKEQAKGKERLKTTQAEQEMKKRRGEPSRKEDIKTRIHQIFETSRTTDDLIVALQKEGLEFYQRGKTVGVIDAETGRKHRLSTLGVGEHYEATMARLFGVGKTQEPNQTDPRTRQPDEPGPQGKQPDERERDHDTGRPTNHAEPDRDADRRDGRSEEPPKRDHRDGEGIRPEPAYESQRESDTRHQSHAGTEERDITDEPGREERRRAELQDLFRHKEPERTRDQDDERER